MRTIFEELIKKSDKSWYENLLFNRSTTKMTAWERSDIIDSCMNTSIEVKNKLTKQYRKMSAKAYAEILGIEVEEETGDIIEGFLYMALYQPSSNVITINKSVIDIVEKFIIDHGMEDMIPWNIILEIVLYHEVFHAMEDKIEGIYTRSKMIKKTHFGLFSSHSGLDVASEIGAIHFSKIMCEMDFSPCIYEQILLLATDQSYKEKLINFITKNNI